MTLIPIVRALLPFVTSLVERLARHTRKRGHGRESCYIPAHPVVMGI